MWIFYWLLVLGVCIIHALLLAALACLGCCQVQQQQMESKSKMQREWERQLKAAVGDLGLEDGSEGRWNYME